MKQSERQDDQLVKLLREQWKPEEIDAQSFRRGLHRKIASHKRKQIVVRSLVAFLCVGSVMAWAAQLDDSLALEAVVSKQHLAQAAQNEDKHGVVDGDDWWDSAYDNDEDNEYLPAEYRELAMLFLETDAGGDDEF